MTETAQRASLGSRVLKAGSWSLLGTLALHGLRLASNLIMTRLLLPEAFGLMALIVTVLLALSLLSDLGIHRSVVREPDGDTERFLRVAWMVKCLRGGIVGAGFLLVALAAALMGPVLAAPDTVYADPRLPGLLVLCALAPVILGAEATTRELALRNLMLGRIKVVQIIAQIVAILAMVLFASISPTVWALAAGMLMNQLVTTALSHVVYPGPRMAVLWDAEIADRLWQYGKWLIGSSAFTFLARNWDRLYLGGVISATAFGVYAIAQVWIDAARQMVQIVLDTVGFSALGEVIRERPDDVPRLFRKFQTIADGICLMCFVVPYALGPMLIDLIYLPVYTDAGHHMQILALGLLAMRFETFNMLILNMGKSQVMMWISAIRAGAIMVSLPLAYMWFGLTGALCAVALSSLVSVPYALYHTRPVLGAQQRIDIAVFFGILLISVLSIGALLM